MRWRHGRWVMRILEIARPRVGPVLRGIAESIQALLVGALDMAVHEIAVGAAGMAGRLFQKYATEGKPGDYLKLARKWKPGDTVEIDMNMTERWIDGGPHAYPGFAAFQRGPQIYALEKAVNPGVNLALAGLNGKYGTHEGPKGSLLIDGAVLDKGALAERKLALVPFSEATDYRIWLPQADRLKTMTAVSLFAFGRETIQPRRTSDQGSIADERLDTWRRAASFAVAAETPKRLSRVVFKHGRVLDDGGWFDTSAGKPKIEIQRVEKGPWETLGTLDSYPETTAAEPPQLTDGQAFEWKLSTPLDAIAIRITGKAARQFASCAELAAY